MSIHVINPCHEPEGAAVIATDKTGKRIDGRGSLWWNDARRRWELRLTDKRLPKGVATWTTNKFPNTKWGRQKADRLLGAKRDAMLHNLEANRPPKESDMLVSFAVAYWRDRELENRSGLAPTTIARYEWALEMIDREFGKLRVVGLKPSAIENGLRHIASGKYRRHVGRGDDPQPLKRESVGRVRATLIDVLDLMVRDEHIHDHSADRSRLPKPVPADDSASDDDRPETRSFDRDQVRLFIEACRSEGTVGALLTVIVTTGLRPGEATALHWDSVDVECGAVTVRRGVRRTADGRMTVVPTLKTDHSFRTIAVPADGRRAIADQLDCTDSDDDETLLFPSPTGRIIDPAWLRRQMTRICCAHDLPALTPNELRHTCASLLVDAGVPLHEIADRLGHKNTRMLEDTYRHRIRPVVDGGVHELDRVFAGA